MTGLQTAHYGSFIPTTLFNFILGTALLAVLAAVRTVGDGTFAAPPTTGWYYLRGPLGVMCVGLASYLAKHLGVLMTSLGMITGQLVGALALEVVWPASARTGFPVLEVLARPWRSAASLSPRRRGRHRPSVRRHVRRPVCSLERAASDRPLIGYERTKLTVLRSVGLVPSPQLSRCCRRPVRAPGLRLVQPRPSGQRAGSPRLVGRFFPGWKPT